MMSALARTSTKARLFCRPEVQGSRCRALPAEMMVKAQADAQQWDTSATAKARTNCGTPLLAESMDLNKNRKPEISTGHHQPTRLLRYALMQASNGHSPSAVIHTVSPAIL